MNSDPTIADRLSFERGGPIQRLGQQLAQKWGIRHSIRNRVLACLALTWLPLAVFAVLEGRAIGPTPQESLLLDFGTYVRFFVGVPLLLIAEVVVGPRLKAAGLQFVDGGLIRPEDQPAFEQSIDQAARWRESLWAELMIVGFVLFAAWRFTAENLYGENVSTWRSVMRPTAAGAGLSFTGLWYRVVALPILGFYWYRWMWRLFLWGRFLWSTSRLDLNLIATHADQAGGLAFLGTAHSSFGIFAFGLSSILSAEAAFRMVFQNADIRSFQTPFVAVVLVVELLLLGPLLMFVPVLTRTRLRALHDYGLLVTRYNRAFHEKWVEGKVPADDTLLGTPDIQSLADLGNSLEFVRSMGVVPINRRVAIQLAIVTSLPCLPLFLLVMPLGKILELLTKAVF